MSHYPLFLDISDQNAVVVGAGRVATRKIRSLLAAGATVTVVSPRAAGAIERLSRDHRIRWIRRRYRAADLHGARLVIAATDDEQVNQRVCAEANRRKLLVNCAAPPEAGNFIVPALVRKGRLMIAVSTGGASPALAKHLRRQLEEIISDSYSEVASKMEKVRKNVAGTMKSTRERRALYRRLVKQWTKRR